MAMLYNLDLKDYAENAEMTKRASVKVLVISDHSVLLEKKTEQGICEIPSIRVQADKAESKSMYPAL